MSAAPDPVLAGDPLNFTIAGAKLGPEPEIRIYVTAPAVGGTLSMTSSVLAANDPNPDNDVTTEEILVVHETTTDLAVVKEDGGVPIVPGQPITYSITVTNNGPNPVYGATVTDYFPPELHSVTWTCEGAHFAPRVARATSSKPWISYRRGRCSTRRRRSWRKGRPDRSPTSPR